MVEEIASGERRARKPHRCFDCYRTIPKGAMHHYFTVKYDGVYTLHSHSDCHAAALEYTSDWYAFDYDDGIPPLANMISDSGEFQAECDRMRGYFPHVVARLELTVLTLTCLAGTLTLAMPADAAARVTEPVRAAFCAHADRYGAPFPGDELWRRLRAEVDEEMRRGQ